MYAILWRKLPGNRWVKALITAVVLVAVFFLLMEVVFPWISAMMPYNDVAV
ncbi:hypothetical protein MHK13_09740 [Corynebacterium hadale]|uniref:hypothetical protein n=1 Tax=Corynebacterium hadale TaxID=2026255 RepID=UPI001EF1E6CC|nr:hypothetical protein [Corynebacterium hadale]MCG7255005.1 hypothetical protein [Corynebacterium hadale]MCG7257194.1 hypothetical protein [Corynebacterium hadale]MCG7265911.1 hypothetical protein [Corynebacterium hadale]